MAATIDSLLADPALGLRLVTGTPEARRRPIEWATSTETLDPAPFLTGGQFVLTTGLRLRSAKAWRAFVASLVESGSVGLGLGTGFTHERVPAAVLDAADAADLPVVEVPYATSFSAITRAVGVAHTSEQVASLASLQRTQQHLVASLLSDDGLEGLVTELARATGAHAAITRYGDVLAGTFDIDDDVTGWEALPIATGKSTHATLHVSAPRNDEAAVTVARSLIGLHLAQEARRVRAARVQSGQFLQDLVGGRLAPDEAALRLAALGLLEGGRSRILLVDGGGRRADALGALPLPTGLRHAATAVAWDRLVVVLPAREPARDAAEAILAIARAAGVPARIGIGDAYPSAIGLRWSYFEARDAIAHLGDGEDIGEASRLSIAALILASGDAPVRELADETLAPLERSDAEQGTALVATLRSFLDRSGAVADVAAELGTHRNTVRYRIDQIASLTGFDPRVTADAVQLWLALAARRIGG